MRKACLLIEMRTAWWCGWTDGHPVGFPSDANWETVLVTLPCYCLQQSHAEAGSAVCDGTWYDFCTKMTTALWNELSFEPELDLLSPI